MVLAFAGDSTITRLRWFDALFETFFGDFEVVFFAMDRIHGDRDNATYLNIFGMWKASFMYFQNKAKGRARLFESAKLRFPTCYCEKNPYYGF